MSIFDSITRPKWQHKNPETRKKAIALLNDQNLLLGIVKTDTNTDIQVATLTQITDANILDLIIDTLEQELSPTLHQQAKRQRLRQLLPEQVSSHSQQGSNSTAENPSVDGPPVESPSLKNLSLEGVKDDTTLVRIASLTSDAELLKAAIAQIQNQEILEDIAHSHELAKIRLRAAQNIHEIARLKELMLATKGHDKAVYRHCKTLIDQHQADQQAKIEQQEKIQKLINDVNQLSQAAESPTYKGRCHQLKHQWSTLSEEASGEQQQQFHKDFIICEQRLAAIAEAQSNDQRHQLELANAHQVFDALITEIEDLNESPTPITDSHASTQLTGLLNDLDQRWQAGSKICAAPADANRTFKKHLKTWRSILSTLEKLDTKKPLVEKLLRDAKNLDDSDYQGLQSRAETIKKLIATLPWPESHQTSLPGQLCQLNQTLTQINSQLDTLKQRQEKHTAQANTALDNLRAALNENRSKDANRAHNKVKQILKSLSPKAQQAFDEPLKQLIIQLSEIRDWQDFALEPKKLELCASMEVLIGSDDEAELLSSKIQALQEQWKQLGVLPHGVREQQLWKQFKAAADKAWLPCKTAFSEQANLRRANFQNRMALVAQLKDYENNMAWPEQPPSVSDGDTDGGSTEDGPPESSSPENSSPEDSSPEDTSAEDTAPNSTPDWPLVQETLDAAREAFKHIQPLDSEGERKSQKAFRRVCDQIYSHIKDEYQRNIGLKERLVTRAETLAGLEDLPDAIEQAKRLQRDWKTVGMTPVKVDRKLWQGFRKACDQVFARLDQERDQRKAEIDEQVTEAQALLRQAYDLLSFDDNSQHPPIKKELAELTEQFYKLELPGNARQRLGKGFEDARNKAEKLVDDIRSRREQTSWDLLAIKIKACAQKNTDSTTAINLWEQAGDLPKGIHSKTLEAFWQQGPGTNGDEQLREACIALEIFGELESPSEDKTARMNYQMQRLVKGIGKQETQTLQSQINDFIDLRPASSWAVRFCSNLEKIRT